jgi:pilus assembly protein CpaF
MCSIHANSAREAIEKMCTLPLLASSKTSSQVMTRSRPAITDARQFSSDTCT